MGTAYEEKPLDLDQLSDLLRIATKGPWKRERNDIEGPGEYVLAITHPREGRLRQRSALVPEETIGDEERANGELLALSRRLAAEVIDLRRELEEQKALVAKRLT